MTEGAFKAFKASLCGFDIVGLTSITHYAESEKGRMIHSAIRKIIDRCGVKKVVMIYDGDCLNISDKDLEFKRDLTSRPNRFYKSMLKIQELLIDPDIEVYFSHIMSTDIPGQPKGLDDLLCAFPDKQQEIRDDLYTLGKIGSYFFRMNGKLFQSKLKKYFGLKDVNQFVSLWGDKLDKREFVFKGDLYTWDEKRDIYIVSIPKDLRNFFRVNNTFYKNVELWDPELNHTIYKRIRYDRSIIALDFGNDALKKIPTYEDFTYYPDNINYQRVNGNCYNLYEEIPFFPEKGECPTILKYLEHIFEEQLEYGLDYVQLLYQQPRQKLPILCLVSNERNTGKTTFLNLLNDIFGGNAVTVGNSEISSEFNGLIAGKLIVGVDETALSDNDKVTERLKMLSTAEYIPMQLKGKDTVMIKNYAKFILVSNNETRFIYTQEEEVRFWVRKIRPIPAEELDPDIKEKMINEIPAFLYYLGNRKMTTKKEYRSWFKPELLETEALRKLKEQQRPKSVKVFIEAAKDLFLTFPREEYEVSPKLVKDWIPYFNNRGDDDQLRWLFEDYFKLEQVKIPVNKRIKIPTANAINDNYTAPVYIIHLARVRYKITAEMFLNAEELAVMRAQLPDSGENPAQKTEQNELDF